jgi:hypothetical protein
MDLGFQCHFSTNDGFLDVQEAFSRICWDGGDASSRADEDSWSQPRKKASFPFPLYDHYARIAGTEI